MTVSASIATFVAGQRELLARMEQFACTPEFNRLLAAIAPMAIGDPEPWLAGRLIQPAFGLGALPIDVAIQPGGLERLEHLLLRIVACAYV